MATSYTSLLGLALPVTGELAGTWGDVVNNSITSLLDSAVAGTTTLSTDADVTLTTTTGGSNQARQAILLCSGARTAIRNITAPAQSKIYAVVNSTTGGYAVVIRGAGPTTGVTVANGKTALVIWNGSDFVELAPAAATTATNLAGGLAGSVPYQTAASTTAMLAIGSQYQVLTSSGSAPQWSSSLQNLTSITSTGNITGTSLTAHPTLQGQIGSYNVAAFSNTTGLVGIGRYVAGSGSTTLGQLFFISDGSTQRASLSCVEESSGEAAYLALGTRNSSNVLAERVRIDSSGRLLVTGGTTTGMSKQVNVYSAAEGAVLLAADSTGDMSVAFRDQTAGTNWGGISAYNNSGTNQYIVISNNGEKVRVAANGNVGIGTNSPSQLLHIASGDAAQLIENTAAASNAALQLKYPSRTWSIANRGADLSGALAIRDVTASEDRLVIDSSGNVGLGTSSPGVKLQVQGTVRSAGASTLLAATDGLSTATDALGFGLSLQNTQATDGTYNQAAISVTNASSIQQVAYFRAISNTGASTYAPTISLLQRTGVTAITERLRIDASGNLGLGTSSPRNVANYKFISTDATTGSGLSCYVGGALGLSAYSTATLSYITESRAIPIVFETTNTERMRIDSSGNVGIGTTSPSELLYVAASQNGVTRTRTDNANTGTAAQAQFSLRNSTGTLANFGLTGGAFTTSGVFRQDGAYLTSGGAGGLTLGTQAAQPIYLIINSAEVARIDASGNVAIGSVTAANKGQLQVNGTGSDLVVGYMGRLAGNANEATLGANLYYNGSTDVYYNSSRSAYRMVFDTVNSIFKFQYAASGTANAAISFTEAYRVDASGNVLITGPGGLGYGTGSGGAVTQGTSRTTGVTLNKTNGAITLVSAAGTATWQSFTVTNSTVAATDTIMVNQKSGTDLYMIHVTAVSAGSFRISFATTGGTTTEQPVFNFAVIKAVAS